jgi:hypothetical protein
MRRDTREVENTIYEVNFVKFNFIAVDHASQDPSYIRILMLKSRSVAFDPCHNTRNVADLGGKYLLVTCIRVSFEGANEPTIITEFISHILCAVSEVIAAILSVLRWFKQARVVLLFRGSLARYYDERERIARRIVSFPFTFHGCFVHLPSGYTVAYHRARLYACHMQ